MFRILGTADGGVQLIERITVQPQRLLFRIPENIMFQNEEDISTLKLIDFGLASFNNKENEYCGTFLYMAPEILFNNKKLLTNEIDIWSVGIIM